MLRTHGFDSVKERRLFSIAAQSPVAFPPESLPTPHFVCLLAWDAREASTDVVRTVVIPLLQAGASYFVVWGPDCERVHDIIDGVLVSPPDNLHLPSDSLVMTTWHDSVPLKEALWFFLSCTWPDESFERSTKSGLAVSIGSDVWAEEIARALDDPDGFMRSGADDSAA